MGREAKTHNKLTRKQASFVKGILSGKNPTQSAMIAYDVSNSKTASVIASQNLNKLSIREALEEALSSNGLSLSTITSNLGVLANSKPEKISGDTVLKANVELLKLQDAYPDKKSYQFQMSTSLSSKLDNMTLEEAKESLRELTQSVGKVLEIVEESESQRYPHPTTSTFKKF